jgi:phospholipid transport system substrate-binding protein
MISRRLLLLGAGFVVGMLLVTPLSAAAEQQSPAVTISSFYDALVATMKEGPVLGFKGRSERLAPAIRHAFDLPQMTRLMVGPQWNNLTPDQQRQLVTAFSDFSIAVYASRFDDYSGERFQIDADITRSNSGMIVHTKLIKTDGDSVQIDYLMRDSDGDGIWQIIDVYLSGTVSELATRRSEFSSVMRRGGADALVDLLQKKAAELRG